MLFVINTYIIFVLIINKIKVSIPFVIKSFSFPTFFAAILKYS